MPFLTERKERMLYPTPQNGAMVEISPPGLAWLPDEVASGYRLEIRDKGGSLVYERTVGSDPVHLPDQVLPPGRYVWDVVALDAQGNESAHRGKQKFTIPEGVPELPWVEPEELLARVPKGHPRLLYTARELPAIRASLNTTRKFSWQMQMEAAKRALQVPAPTYPNYHRTEDLTQCWLEYTAYFRAFQRCIDVALMDLSLSFLMSEDAKYAEAAKRILLEVASWPTDDADVTSVSAKWGDEPGLHLARCVHHAYDWLYWALSEDEQTKILKMCEARAWQSYRRLVNRDNYLTYPGESHSARLVAYLSEMAIAMAGESDGASTWLDYSLKALTSFYPHWGGYEGGWAEGIRYGLRYNIYPIPAFEALRSVCCFDLWKRPIFRKVRYFFFYCTAPRGEIWPFGDGAELSGVLLSDEKERLASVLRFHAHLYSDPRIGWFVNEIDGWRSVHGELPLLLENELPSMVPVDLPNARVFRDVGWAGLHSDLSKPDEDTFLVFKSSPYGSVSHSHADQNAFAILKGGKALAIPSGYYGPSYGMPHHAEWTRSTKANNCLLVNGEGQRIGDHSAKGRIAAYEDRGQLSYIVGDAAEAYMGKLRRFRRHVLFLRPGLFLLLDDIEAAEAARFQWMLHALQKMSVDPEGGGVVSRRDGATLDIRLRCPAGLKFSQTNRFDTPYNDRIPEQFQQDMPLHWHLTAETESDVEETRIGAAMGVWGPNETFHLEGLEYPGWCGARANGRFGSVEGWIQLVPAAPGPKGYNDEVSQGKAMLCGTAVDGDQFAI